MLGRENAGDDDGGLEMKEKYRHDDDDDDDDDDDEDDGNDDNNNGDDATNDRYGPNDDNRVRGRTTISLALLVRIIIFIIFISVAYSIQVKSSQ